MSFYGAGSYLVNPRDTNGAPSVVVGLGFAGNPALASVLVNTVADSYLLRTGATFHLKGGLSASLGFRMEGVPRYDLIGDSHGFRRPGYETYAEPGLIYRTGPRRCPTRRRPRLHYWSHEFPRLPYFGRDRPTNP